MFNSIGRKIKMLAQVICWTGIVGSVAATVAVFVVPDIEAYYYRIYPQGVSIKLLALLILFLGPLFSWISMFALYALGDVAENSARQARLLRNLKEQMEDMYSHELSSVVRPLNQGAAPADGGFLNEMRIMNEMLVKLVVNLKTADEADVARVFSENGISYVRKDSFVKEDDFDDGVHTVEYSVRRANFHRAHALLLKEFKDNPEVLKAIVPRTSADS